MRVFLYSCILVMFTVFSSLFAQETITVQPDDKVVTNAAAARIKGSPAEKDLVKSVDLAENTLFSIKLNATNFDRYIRITSYSTNLDFVRFTRDKTNAFITFRTLTAGLGKLDFQVDNEQSIIRKYFYTINVTTATNNMNNAATNNTATNNMNNAATNNTATNNMNNTATNNTDTNRVNIIVNADTGNTTVNNANTDQPVNNTQASAKKENSKTPAGANPETVALFNSAEDLRNIKDYKNAVNTYNKVISEYPDSKYSVYSHFRIGDIYNYNKDYTNAFDMYQKASTLKGANNDEKAAAIYSMGVIKKLENKHDEAIAYFNDVMTKYSKSAVYGNAAYEVADSLKQLGRISDGASILEKSLDGNKKFSKRGDAILLLAEIYEKGNNNVRNFDKAYQTYNQYLTEYPSSSKAQYANDRKNFLYRNAVNLR